MGTLCTGSIQQKMGPAVFFVPYERLEKERDEANMTKAEGYRATLGSENDKCDRMRASMIFD